MSSVQAARFGAEGGGNIAFFCAIARQLRWLVGGMTSVCAAVYLSNSCGVGILCMRPRVSVYDLTPCFKDDIDFGPMAPAPGALASPEMMMSFRLREWPLWLSLPYHVSLLSWRWAVSPFHCIPFVVGVIDSPPNLLGPLLTQL